ncbi:hypothetical protein ACX80D_01510 [Arthrobacter sp. Sr24]
MSVCAARSAGEILLTPLVTIPKREIVAWEDENIRASLAVGLAQNASGDVVNLGDFTQYLDAEDS